jgi:hypothetical protein
MVGEATMEGPIPPNGNDQVGTVENSKWTLDSLRQQSDNVLDAAVSVHPDHDNPAPDDDNGSVEELKPPPPFPQYDEKLARNWLADKSAWG